MQTIGQENAVKPVLVIGGTGKTGRRVAAQLAERGVPVRIGSRGGSPSFDWAEPEGWAAVLAGTRAARVEVVAPGTGSEIAPSGLNKPAAPEGRELTPTREVTVGFPRPDGSLFLAWRMPESARERVMPGVEKALATLALPPSAAPSRY